MKSIHAGTSLIMLWLSACGPGNRPYDATGTFEAVEVTVSAEAAGKLLRFDVEEGTVLHAGAQVGIIDTVQLSLMMRQQEANRRSVDSRLPEFDRQVAALKQQIATAEREKHRISNLLEAGAANRKQLDDIEAQIALYRKQLDAQAASLESSARSLTEQSSALSLDRARLLDQLMKCHVTAPIGGTVLAKYMEAGELATVGKPLFKIADMEHIFLRAYITSAQLSEVKTGDSVTVIADYGADRRTEYPGVITWISGRAEFTPKTILTADERANLVYAVKIAVENDGYLKLGMYGGVRWTR
jgi:HlyD family secretion protein